MTRREFIPAASLLTAAVAGIGAISPSERQRKFPCIMLRILECLSIVLGMI